jgi:type II secretory pathway component PulJ
MGTASQTNTAQGTRAERLAAINRRMAFLKDMIRGETKLGRVAELSLQMQHLRAEKAAILNEIETDQKAIAGAVDRLVKEVCD